MSNQSQIATRPSAIAAMATRFNVESAKLLSTLKETCFKGATDEQMLALVVVANEYDLNPFLKEIYAFPAKGGGIVPVVGVDGWIKLMNRRTEFDGIEFEYNEKDGTQVSVTSLIFIKGRSRPVKVTEFLCECKRNTDPWNTSPRRMLRHKALIQGARVAFGFSGIHDEDEAADFAKFVTGREVKPIFTAPKQLPPAEVNPESEQKPADPAPTPPVEQAPTETPLEELARLCGECDVKMDQVFAYAKAIPDFVRPTCGSIANLPVAKLKSLINDFGNVVEQVREMEGAGE